MNVLNVLGVAFFTAVLCWRVHRLVRAREGVQAVAMTIAIGSLTLSPLLLNRTMGPLVDSYTIPGLSRVCGYALIVLGVASLAVTFFYGHTESARQRRAGIEAVPLVVAVVGLSVAMTVTPDALRQAALNALTVREVGLAAFFVVAGAYLVYGLADCVFSLIQLMPFARGYLTRSLKLMAVGLGVASLGSLLQVAFIVVNLLKVASMPPVLTSSRVITVAGVVLFIVGICYPGVRGIVVAAKYRRLHRRNYRRLGPLWRELTAVLPDIVLPGERRGWRTDVHLVYQRRVVEIRDVLVQISPYLPDDFGHKDPATNVAEMRVAIQAYQMLGAASQPTRMVLPANGPTVDDDAAPLLVLSDEVRSHPPATAGVTGGAAGGAAS
ncbi:MULTISPECIES: MAB_1171c family putative transporter [unclassified Tsukamurella]|uniref:MAB_1171c family putative transporter n=1 Tax=unclassified Tsukamurella TaxID=2633480 RepID=UPI0031BA8781